MQQRAPALAADSAPLAGISCPPAGRALLAPACHRSFPLRLTQRCTGYTSLQVMIDFQRDFMLEGGFGATLGNDVGILKVGCFAQELYHEFVRRMSVSAACKLPHPGPCFASYDGRVCGLDRHCHARWSRQCAALHA